MRPLTPDDFTTTPTRTYSLHFFIHSVPFTRDVIEGVSSLGGSESACLSVARSLAARGHDVQIYAVDLDPDLDGQKIDGVIWHVAEKMGDMLCLTDVDSFTSLRTAVPFSDTVPAKHIALWNQDLLIDTSMVGLVSQVDELLYVSEYHRRQWQAAASDLARCRSAIVMNPIDVARVPETSRARRLRERYVVHTSRPERGYDAMIDLWPAIRERYPETKLKLCRYSSMYDAQGWARICKRYEDEITCLDGVEFVGELNKESLYDLIAGSLLLWYPTSQRGFAETNCITMTEAMACQTPVVADRRGGIVETLHPAAGILIENVDVDHWKSEAYRDDTLEAFKTILGPDEGTPSTWRVGKDAVDAARGRDGSVVAWAWEKRLDAFFDERYRASKIGIVRHLLHDDNHAAAKVLALEIDGETEGGSIEAREAVDLCDQVIRQEAQTADQYAQFAVQDPKLEAAAQSGIGSRFTAASNALLEGVDEGATLKVLDLACGNGSFGIKLREDAGKRGIRLDLTMVDYSDRLLEIVNTALEGEDGYRTVCADAFSFLSSQEAGTYDGVWCGEFLEHVERPWELVEELERVTKKGCRVVVSTPIGPMGELLPRNTPRQRGHIHCFTARDIKAMFGQKKATLSVLPTTHSQMSGDPCGFWMVSWTPGEGRSEPIDYARQILVERPRETLHACLITRDAEDHILACIKSLWVADEVHIYDTGSRDSTVSIAMSAGAHVVQGGWTNNFAEARNRSVQLGLDAGADWILWIDADEVLHGGHNIRRLLCPTSPFNGYAIKQHHLQVDLPNFYDQPVRAFRARPRAADGSLLPTPRFYGVVHEQPEMEMNKGILPSLQLEDVMITHIGYQTAAQRNTKAQRNYSLLRHEISGKGPHPPRTLAWALWMRDLCQYAEREQDESKRQKFYGEVLSVWRRMGWDDPATDPAMHKLGWPFYQIALQKLGLGIHVVHSLSAASQGAARPEEHEKLIAANVDDAARLLAWRAKQKLDPIRRPDTLLV